MPHPVAYHIVFTTYGTWPHGDARGSWDKHTHKPLEVDPLLNERRRRQLKHPPVTMTEVMRAAVDAAVREVCRHRAWRLFALNVRTNHVHVAVAAHTDPDRMLHDFKAYATRRLRANGLVGADARVWTAKGGIKGVSGQDGVARLIEYVLNQ